MSFEDILKKVNHITDKKDFLSVLNKVSDEYYNSFSTELKDTEFDTLVCMYEKQFNEEYIYLGSKGDIKLPVFMPSLNKVKDNHALGLIRRGVRMTLMLYLIKLMDYLY